MNNFLIGVAIGFVIGVIFVILFVSWVESKGEDYDKRNE